MYNQKYYGVSKVNIYSIKSMNIWFQQQFSSNCTANNGFYTTNLKEVPVVGSSWDLHCCTATCLLPDQQMSPLYQSPLQQSTSLAAPTLCHHWNGNINNFSYHKSMSHNLFHKLGYNIKYTYSISLISLIKVELRVPWSWDTIVIRWHKALVVICIEVTTDKG